MYFGEKKHLFSLSVIAPRFYSHSAHSLDTTLTELPQLPKKL